MTLEEMNRLEQEKGSGIIWEDVTFLYVINGGLSKKKETENERD